jgi:hypothetical protein
MGRGMALKTSVVIVLGVVALGVKPLAAQEVPPPVPPPPTPIAAPQPAPAVTPPAPPAIDVTTRRKQIALMEGLLTSAVGNGARETARQIQAVQPGLQLFTGTARARGIHLEGYGVFFNVEIPGVQPSVDWILSTLERSRVGRQPGAQAGQASLAGTQSEPMLDANAIYTEAVQQNLIGAMLDLRIDLLPDEWLTIAARDGAGPIGPGQIYDSITMVLRVRGSDVADFRAGRITREALQKKVEVREF